MINQESITFMQSVIISGVGIMVVLSILSILAISIMVFSKMLSLFGDGTEKVEQAKKEEIIEEDFTENYAIILSVMDQELNKNGEKYRITSINEVSL